MANIELTSPDDRDEDSIHDHDLPVGHIRRRRKRSLFWSDKYTFSPPIEAFSDVRDYYALERTYLAYVRTANTLIQYGIVVGQLFMLQQGRSTLGKACSVIMSLCGIVTVVAGAVRHFRQDKAFRNNSRCSSGQFTSASRNINMIAGMVLVVLSGLLIILLVST